MKNKAGFTCKAAEFYAKKTHGNCRCKEALFKSPAVTCLCLPAGTAVTCSVPAVATRRSQCQASSCSSPAASVRPATAASSSAQLPWTWSWRNPSRPAPTEFQRSGTGCAASRQRRRSAEEEHRSYTECPMYLNVCVCWYMEFNVYIQRMTWQRS